MCIKYKYRAEVPNPDYNPELDPPDPDVPPVIPNPETTHQYANRMTRDFLINNTEAYEIRKAKKNNPYNKIVVTGCAAQINPKKYESLKEVDLVVGNKEKLLNNFFLNSLNINFSSMNTILFKVFV